MALQRLAGNRAVSALLTSGPADDRGPVSQDAGAAPHIEEPSIDLQLGAAKSDAPPSRDSVPPVQRWGLSSVTGAIGRGVSAVAGGVASLASGVKDRVLGTLAGWARRMPGYELLCTVLGRDVVAGTPVPRSAAAIISGFLGLIPGGATMRQNLQESGAVDRAGTWFETEIPKLGLTWDVIRGLFQRAWDGLGASDLLDPAGAWRRISGIFGPPLARLRDFAVAAGSKVLEFVFEGALSMAGGLGTQVMAIVRRAGGVVTQIFRDPIGFAGNLVSAVRGGLGQFLANIAGHLRTGLFGWLTGALRGAVRLPAQFDLRGILSMAMEFLGVTWANLRGRLVAMVGAQRVTQLERGVAVVQDVATRGLGAITDRIASFTSGLLDTVIGGIRDWVANSVVGAAITRLISMFNPAGAVIQAIIAVYNTVKFFIERAQQLGALANSVFDSIGAIAGGSIGAAKNAVEQAMGRAVPVVLGFLSRLIGLGDVATPVRNVVNRVRGVIDGAMNRVLGWIAGMAGRLTGRSHRSAGSAAESGEAKTRRLNAGLDEADALVRRQLPAPSIRAQLPDIRRRHGMTSLDLVIDSEAPERQIVHIVGAVNPSGSRAQKPIPGGHRTYDPATRSANQRWVDAILANKYVSSETAEEGLERVRLAKAMISGQARLTVLDCVLSFNEGRDPRTFGSVVAEDGLGGHTTVKHVKGMGRVYDDRRLARRILYGEPDPAGSQASYFTSLSQADASVARALTKLTADWKQDGEGHSGPYRDCIVTMPRVRLQHPTGAVGYALKIDTRVAAPGDRPSYAGGTYRGPMYPGDPLAHDPTLDPMTMPVACTSVRVVLQSSAQAPGGWFILTAYPEP